MTQVAESILKMLLELPVSDRTEVVEQAYESLWNTKLNAEEAIAWQSFLEERIAEADRGDFAHGTPFDVIEEIRLELAEGKL